MWLVGWGVEGEWWWTRLWLSERFDKHLFSFLFTECVA